MRYEKTILPRLATIHNVAYIRHVQQAAIAA